MSFFSCHAFILSDPKLNILVKLSMYDCTRINILDLKDGWMRAAESLSDCRDINKINRRRMRSGRQMGRQTAKEKKTNMQSDNEVGTHDDV